ncbi:MAG: transglycosylase domain-containing protein, partial [Anaerovoracaceae bacterium]
MATNKKNVRMGDPRYKKGHLDRFEQKVTNSFTSKYIVPKNKIKEPTNIGPSLYASDSNIYPDKLVIDEVPRKKRNTTSSTKATRRERSGKMPVSSSKKNVNQSKGKSSNHKKKSKVKKKFTFIKLLIGMAVAGMFFVLIFIGTIVANAPVINTSNIYTYLSESSVVYDDKGNEVENIAFGDGNRFKISYEEMPQNVKNAIVAIEDKTFWEHHGFNYVRLAGAVFESLTGGGNISGTSTISQQLARNVYLSETKDVRSISRKITEAYYTTIIERNLTKEQILEAYLNTVSFGYSSYGVEAASKAYFSKSAKNLNLAECAAIAALPKSPNTYALIYRVDANNAQLLNEVNKKDIIGKDNEFVFVFNGEPSRDRRETTLTFMAEQGYISDKEKTSAMNENLRKDIDLNLNLNKSLSTYFSDYMLEQVKEDLVNKKNYSEAEAEQLIFG